jgi:hypothetical protein
MEAAVGERAAETFVEEKERQRDVNAFRRQAVGIAPAIALQQTMAFEFAQIVPELVESVGFRGELEGGEDCLVNLFGRPAADGAAVVQENLQPKFVTTLIVSGYFQSSAGVKLCGINGAFRKQRCSADLPS